MKNKNKKQYIAPALKCVEFKVERGYDLSQSLGSQPLGDASTYNFLDDPNRYKDDGRCYKGFFSGDNGDWD